MLSVLEPVVIYIEIISKSVRLNESSKKAVLLYRVHHMITPVPTFSLDSALSFLNSVAFFLCVLVSPS